MSEGARPTIEIDIEFSSDAEHDVEIFATGDSEMLGPRSDVLAGVVSGAVRRGSAAILDLHARPGYRPGAKIATSSGRRTGPSDIVRPVLVDPRRACALAGDGELFSTRIDGLELDDEQADDSRQFLVWTGRMSGAHIGVVPISLHLLASPSLVVTVLELVPQERLRWHRRSFVRAGIDVVEALAVRLDRLAGPPHPVADAC